MGRERSERPCANKVLTFPLLTQKHCFEKYDTTQVWTSMFPTSTFPRAKLEFSYTNFSIVIAKFLPHQLHATSGKTCFSYTNFHFANLIFAEPTYEPKLDIIRLVMTFPNRVAVICSQ